MIGAGQLWQIASAWVDGIGAGLQKNSPRMHGMIDRRVRAFLQGLARSQTAMQGGGLYCAVQNGEFSYRYTAPPRIEAASRPGGWLRRRDTRTSNTPIILAAEHLSRSRCPQTPNYMKGRRPHHSTRFPADGIFQTIGSRHQGRVVEPSAEFASNACELAAAREGLKVVESFLEQRPSSCTRAFDFIVLSSLLARPGAGGGPPRCCRDETPRGWHQRERIHGYRPSSAHRPRRRQGSTRSPSRWAPSLIRRGADWPVLRSVPPPPPDPVTRSTEVKALRPKH
jgi:hypothetical protein